MNTREDATLTSTLAFTETAHVHTIAAVDKVAVYKALGDDIRLNIVRKLANVNEPVSSCDIVKSCATFLNLSQPTMSHHFHKLIDAGILREEKTGTQKRYLLDKATLAEAGIDSSQL